MTLESVNTELGRGADPAGGSDSLLLAISYGAHPEIVRLLLESGADPNVQGESGYTPLMIAALGATYTPPPDPAMQIPGYLDNFPANAAEIIELLLEYGADAAIREKYGQTALFLYLATLLEQSVNAGNSDDLAPPDPWIVELLLPEGVGLTAEHESDRLILTYAMWAGADADTIALLLDQGAGAASKGNGYGDVPLLHLAANFTADAQVFKALLDRGEDVAARDSNDWTALHMSVRNGNLDPEVIRLLLDAGADVAARAEDGDTPLHHAASHSGAEVVRLLLERGEDVNAQDRHMKTPLHAATSDGYRWAAEPHVASAEVIALLLENGAEVNARDGEKRTPLHSTALYRHSDAVLLLLENGADVNAKDGGDIAPLHHAASAGDPGSVSLLLEHGVDANAVDTTLQTPLHWVVERSPNPGVVALLLAREWMPTPLMRREKPPCTWR